MKRSITQTFKKGDDTWVKTEDIKQEFERVLCEFEDNKSCFPMKTKITIKIEELK